MTTYSWDTTIQTVERSGSGWTVDVTGCNLSSDLDLKDFQVLFDGIVQSDDLFTKTTRNLLTYTGGDVGSDVQVEVRRLTPVEPYNLVEYQDVFSSADWNKELERISRRVAEIRALGVGSGGVVTIRDDNYGASWSGDTSSGASRRSLYEKFEASTAAYEAADNALSASLATKAPVVSPVFTGTPTAPTAPADTNTTQLATCAFVETRARREKAYSLTVSKNSSQGVSIGGFTTVTSWNTVTHDPQNAFNTTSGVWTCPESGLYLVTGFIGSVSISCGGANMSNIRTVLDIITNDSVFNRVSDIQQNSASPSITTFALSGVTARIFATGDQVKLSLYAAPDGTSTSGTLVEAQLNVFRIG